MIQPGLALACASRAPRAAMAAIGLCFATGNALASPSVQQVGGPLDHNATITISGSGFGSKPTAAPLVWDNATGNLISDKWDGAWPDKLPGYNTQYHGPMRGVNPPHSHDSRFIAGAHAANRGADAGYNVLFYKNIQVQPAPSYIYASWYQLADSDWHFGGDNNFKTFDYSEGASPYANGSWYSCYGPPNPSSNTSAAQWALETGTPLSDAHGHNAWWSEAVNPMAGKWSKVEIMIKVTAQSDGYINVYENGQQVVNYVGVTDNYDGSRRTIAVGGYARMQGFANNWRYFDDVYLDTTLQHVVLADKPILSQAGTIEPQIPSAWSDGSITATVNLGRFSQGQTAYLIVVDANGSASAGVPVTAGGTVGLPSPPPSISVR